MDTVVDELVVLERRCAAGADLLETEEVKRQLSAIADAAAEFARSWSGSCIGYHSCIYYGEYEPVPAGAVFSREWGLMSVRFSNPTRGEWRERPYEEAVDAVLARAGKPDFKMLDRISKEAGGF